MKTWSRLFLIFFLLFPALFAFVSCSCDDDDDDDNDGGDDDDDGDDDSTQEGCNAEKTCYDQTDGCIMGAQDLDALLKCINDGLLCLTLSDGCTTDFISCAAQCAGDLGCFDGCAGTYQSCLTNDCGWDGACMVNCSEDMDTCGGECDGLDFDCMHDCYEIGYHVCMQSCF